MIFIVIQKNTLESRFVSFALDWVWLISGSWLTLTSAPVAFILQLTDRPMEFLVYGLVSRFPAFGLYPLGMIWLFALLVLDVVCYSQQRVISVWLD